MIRKDFKEESKLDQGVDLNETTNLSMEQIKLGCLLRIADCLEQMGRPYVELLETIEYYKEFEIENKKLKKTLAGLRGHINKTKKELQKYKSY